MDDFSCCLFSCYYYYCSSRYSSSYTSYYLSALSKSSIYTSSWASALCTSAIDSWTSTYCSNTLWSCYCCDYYYFCFYLHSFASLVWRWWLPLWVCLACECSDCRSDCNFLEIACSFFCKPSRAMDRFT